MATSPKLPVTKEKRFAGLGDSLKGSTENLAPYSARKTLGEAASKAQPDGAFSLPTVAERRFPVLGDSLKGLTAEMALALARADAPVASKKRQNSPS